jgi:voltage-gated potassium channel
MTSAIKRNPGILGVLLLFVSLFIFIIPLVTVEYQRRLFSIDILVIYMLSALTIERNRNIYIFGAIIAMAIEGITDFVNLTLFNYISKFIVIAFFMLVVSQLIRQIFNRKDVNASTMLEAINGYLLLGTAFSILVNLVNLFFPGSYVFSNGALPRQSDLIYFTFITITTTGYGDITPIFTVARSLSVLISVTGQFYVAVIIALIVGKISASDANSGKAS